MKKPPSIFEDLEIDTSDLLTEPAEFAKRVIAKANELESVLKSDTSVSSFKRQIESRSRSIKCPENIQQMFVDIYAAADESSLEELVKIIDQAKELVRDLDTAFHSRAAYDSVKEKSPLADKRVAHAQHVKLREAYDSFSKFAKMFFDYTPPIIKGQSGNFGSSLSPLKTYVFVIDGDEFMNHFPVIRRLGMNEELKTLMDLLEYLDNHPEAPVEVKEVQF